MSGFDLTKVTFAKAKPLPIILLLDESGSMDGGKIEKLNEAVQNMLAAFKKEETQSYEFLVTIIAFGGSNARIINDPTSASQIEFNGLKANGCTPLGSALKLAKKIIEDKELTPSRAYRPLVVLVTDGRPTDEWKTPFDDFVELGRSAKCDRMALAVGSDADMKMLGSFVAGTGHEVFTTAEAGGIVKFFRFVTMSVVTRTRSQNPNQVPADREIKPISEPSRVKDEIDKATSTNGDTGVIESDVLETKEETSASLGRINLDENNTFWF